jgi:hypothetical protein
MRDDREWLLDILESIERIQKYVREELVERTIDRRINVWFTQLMDALTGLQKEEGAELQYEFAASLRRALEQARSGEGIDLQTFRYQSGLRRCLS